MSESAKDLNILLLGPTGVGKSTFVNALFTYLNHENLDSARNSDLQIPIPFHFIIMDDTFAQHTISYGSDLNERFQPGQSSTQKCKDHALLHNGNSVRIFDTPGMGDTRGVEQDKHNFQETLRVLSKIKYLHGIFILLKPNESKLTTSFAYCVKQLLLKLPKNASENIIFVFTNSRETFYRPGDTVQPLNVLLEEVRAHIDIRLRTDNVFCLDNEVFRFLVASKQGVELSKRKEEEFAESWSRCVEQCNQLMDHVGGMKAGPVKIEDVLKSTEEIGVTRGGKYAWARRSVFVGAGAFLMYRGIKSQGFKTFLLWILFPPFRMISAAYSTLIYFFAHLII